MATTGLGVTDSNRIRVWYLDQNKIWRKKWTKLKAKDDGMTVDVRNKTYVFDRDAITYTPTKLAQLGFGRGVIPTLTVFEECPIPIKFNHNGCQQETSFQMNAFKKNTVIKGALKAAQKESNTETMKWLIIAALIGIGLTLLFLWQLLSKINILQPAPNGG